MWGIRTPLSYWFSSFIFLLSLPMSDMYRVKSPFNPDFPVYLLSVPPCHLVIKDTGSNPSWGFRYSFLIGRSLSNFIGPIDLDGRKNRLAGGPPFRGCPRSRSGADRGVCRPREKRTPRCGVGCLCPTPLWIRATPGRDAWQHDTIPRLRPSIHRPHSKEAVSKPVFPCYVRS